MYDYWFSCQTTIQKYQRKFTLHKKAADISKVFDTLISQYVFQLNTWLRKCLGWKSPYEIYFNISLHLTWLFKGYKTPHISLSVDSFELWVETIKNNLGVGFIHEVACRKNTAHYDTLQQLATVNIKEVWGGTLGCVSRNGDSVLVNAFLECFPDYRKTNWVNDSVQWAMLRNNNFKLWMKK